MGNTAKTEHTDSRENEEQQPSMEAIAAMMRQRKIQEYEDSGYEEIYETFTEEDMFVTMRDGVRLHTYIFKPDGPGTDQDFPVILQRTCYPAQDALSKLHGACLAKRGYIFVYQYCRGIEQSEGAWVPNVNERCDGIDTVNWLYQQPWADGIGYWGCSYLSATGWAISYAVTGKVVSMVLTHYGTDRFKSAYEKGMFRQDVLTAWSMQNCGWEVHADYDQVCRYMPQKEVDTALWGGEVPWYRAYVTNTKKQDAYWQQGWWKQLDEIPEKIQIPILVVEGWYDHHLGSAMNSWDKLGAASKAHSQLVIGPWNHGFQPCIEAQETDHVENSEVKMYLDWFDLTLKQKKLPEKKVRTYQMNEDRWYETDSWEDKTTEQKTMYLDFSQNSLAEDKVDTQSRIAYDFDPADPVHSHGSESCLTSWGVNGSLSQPDPGWRPDVISVMSEPLDRALQITGKIQVKLWVSSDCEDTAFTAKLMRVTPDGQAYNIRSSITTIGQGSIAGENYKPEQQTQVTIDMWDVCYTVRAGERIRLDISSSDYPNFHVHCNYKGIWGEQKKQRIAHQNLYSGGRTSSSVEMEVRRQQ